MHYVMVFCTIFLLSLSTVALNQSYASSFSYVEQLRYATLSEKMIGHIIASYDRLTIKNESHDSIKPDLVNNLEKEFELMKQFYDEHSTFKNKSQYVLFVISNTSDDKEMFDDQTMEILFLAKQGKKLIIDESLLHDKYFNLLTASSLLESSKIELMDSTNTTNTHLAHQGAFGFAIRAHMIIDNIDDLDEELKNDIKMKFIKLFSAFGKESAIDEIVQIEEKIILDIYKYVIENRPVFVDPSGSKNEEERIVLLKTDMSANNMLVTITGSNFPENTPVTITYTTSESDDLNTHNVLTTSDGNFSIPIDLVSENITYFVQATCAKITTNHLLTT